MSGKTTTDLLITALERKIKCLNGVSRADEFLTLAQTLSILRSL